MYKSKKRKIELIPQKSLNYNKSLILADFFNKKLIDYDESKPFNYENMTVKLQFKEKLIDMNN